MKRLTLYITLLFASNFAFSQVVSDRLVPATIYNGDTIPFLTLREVSIMSWRPFRTATEEQAFRRLVNNVKTTYPYARTAAAKMQYYDNLAEKATSKKEKREINKKAEEQIKSQFENDVRNLTQSQGEILIKLIDRQTGKSSYTIISETRGKFRAIFWQSFSYFWGINLKEQYDPLGKDKDIELIVSMIEEGLI